MTSLVLETWKAARLTSNGADDGAAAARAGTDPGFCRLVRAAYLDGARPLAPRW